MAAGQSEFHAAARKDGVAVVGRECSHHTPCRRRGAVATAHESPPALAAALAMGFPVPVARPWRPLATLGRWSLSFYMLHQPVLICLVWAWKTWA
jgi:peptidoglycan/LPS O-acetylase OafA/YrhL